MQRVLDERHKRADGARLDAEVSRAAVQEKLRTYNDVLKKTRAEIFTEQETVRRRVLDERQATITAARTAAQNELQAAKQALAAEVQVVRGQLEQSGAVLADEIADAIRRVFRAVRGDARVETSIVVAAPIIRQVT